MDSGNLAMLLDDDSLTTFPNSHAPNFLMIGDSYDLKRLSREHCILLAAKYASESNIHALRLLASSRHDVLPAELVLKILLTYLPETTDPSQYTDFVDAVAHGKLAGLDQPVPIDTEPIGNWSTTKARKGAKDLNLLPLALSSFPESLCPEILVQFLIHRAHRIEEQSGLLDLIPQLVDPFLDRYAFLRTWFISNVLPLLRLVFEYHPENEQSYTLDQVEWADSEQGMDIWLSRAIGQSDSHDEVDDRAARMKGDQQNTLSRDLKGLVGPWMYGDNERKRRRLNGGSDLRRGSKSENSLEEGDHLQENKDMLSEVGHSWDQAFKRIVWVARSRLPIAAAAIEDWDGPLDVDLGGFDDELRLSADEQRSLKSRYIQTAVAAVYAAEANDKETISSAHGILARVATLAGFDPVPDLHNEVERLQSFHTHRHRSQELPNSMLEAKALLRKNHILTTPDEENFTLLRFCILSASILADLGYPISVVNVAKLRFQLDKDEQLGILQKVFHILSTSPRKSEEEWIEVRRKLLWLWNWGEKPSNENRTAGVFGKVDASVVEEEFIKAFILASCYSAVANIYIKGRKDDHHLSAQAIEQVVISSALNQYDNASNGNRSRGGMKKASDIIAAFRQYYGKSTAFRRIEALLAATHAMSFYSLILQHGVPFQPVNIRVSSDPISLIEKILAQNPGSYSDLRELVSIGANLIAAGLTEQSNDGAHVDLSPAELDSKKRKSERRIIGMAIEAALSEDDFETAYSYVVNQLDTSSAAVQVNGNHNVHGQDGDDIAWRAALAAGRHKSTSPLSASASLSTPPSLRRLEQRMELLSQALLLAPPSALPEVLNVWRKCEEEMSSLLARETQEESEFNDRADRGIPGAFVESAAPVQLRREVGRGASEEAPSGLFDVARGAAAAISRSAFPLRGATKTTRTVQKPQARPVSIISSDGGSEGDGQDRVRKRDMVANAVTGGLASGLGWVLGATPVQNPPPRQ